MPRVVVAVSVPGDSRDDAPTGDESTGAATTAVDPTIDDGVASHVDDPAARCPYCQQPFRRARYERLHRGRVHPGRLSDRERAALDRVRREERAAIRRIRLYALGAVVLLYFGLLIVAAFVV